MRRHCPQPGAMNSWKTSFFSAFAVWRASARLEAQAVLPGLRVAGACADSAGGFGRGVCPRTSAEPSADRSAAATVRFEALEVGIRRENPPRIVGIPPIGENAYDSGGMMSRTLS